VPIAVPHRRRPRRRIIVAVARIPPGRAAFVEAGGEPPEASVVIVSFNGRAHLETCLTALARTAGVRFEVVVADNGSSDGTVAWLRETHPAVRLLELGRNLGFGAANRHGVATARSALIALLNSDTRVEPEWLRVLLDTLEADDSVGAACSTLRLLDRPGTLNARGGGMTRLGIGFDHDYLAAALDSPFDPEPETREVLFPTAAAMAIRRRDFDDIGGFDPEFFMYHEDVDLGWRLWLAGKRVVACRDSVVYHARGGSDASPAAVRNRDRLGARHAVRSLLKGYGPATLAGALLDLTRLWLRRRALGRLAAAAAWNLRHLQGTLRLRRQVQRGRRISDAALLGRGLIDRSALPPVPPEAPRRLAAGAGEALISTPLLRPGYHSSLGRLGEGWHARERDGDGWWRWTCGIATCRLQVAPRARGALLVEARGDGRGQAATPLLVRCNGHATRAELRGAAWRQAVLPVAADERGCLAIELCSPARREEPPARLGGWRSLGCAVRELRFVPEGGEIGRRYASVSVIIPTYNRWPVLQETLNALAGQTCEAFEVIVVDDGSTDGTWDELQAWRQAVRPPWKLTALRQPNLKPGRARNRGLASATGDLVLFLGDDIVPDADLVTEHLAKHNEVADTVAVLGYTGWHEGRVRVTPFLDLVNRDGQQFSYGHFAAGEDVLYTCFYTSNVSLPRWVLGTDPFHPAFTFVDWEDVELGYRLSLRGLRIIYHPRAAARHAHAMTMADFYHRQRHVGRTVGVLLKLHPELAEDDAMPPLRPRWWFPLLRHPLRVLLPLLSAWDRMRLPLPARLHRAVALCGYFAGRAAGDPAPPAPVGA